MGQRLFLQNCAQCHGSDARGQLGFPNLADNAWLYGGQPEAIKTTLMQGRQGNMPAWIDSLGKDGVQEVTSYVLSLSGRKVDQQEAAKGKARFVVCAACHGTDGKGNPAFGAPDLTDNVWLYGGSRRAVEATIVHGRMGVMLLGKMYWAKTKCSFSLHTFGASATVNKQQTATTPAPAILRGLFSLNLAQEVL